MNTLNPEICAFLGLIIIGFVVVIETINYHHYLWSQGDCDAHVNCWLIHGYGGTTVYDENTSTLMFLKEISKVELKKTEEYYTHCRCFKCGKWKDKENFTLSTYEMINPEDAVCFSCTPCEAHVIAYYEHKEWMEEV